MPQYTRPQLAAALEASHFEMKEVHGTRLQEGNPGNIAATFSIAFETAYHETGVSILMTMKLESDVATLKVAGNCTLSLEKGWEIERDEFTGFVSGDCAVVMFPPLRQALSLLNYQIGLPHLALPPQLTAPMREQLRNSQPGSEDLRFKDEDGDQ